MILGETLHFTTIWGELSLNLDFINRCLYSMLLGYLLGLEREYQSKPAGVKTYAMIGLGSTIITYLSIHFSAFGDPARLAAQIVSGIGFIGGGAIFQSKKMISGLTTASSIWVVSALGIMIGADYLLEAFFCMIFIYIYFFISRILPKPKSDRTTFTLFIGLKNFEAIKKIDALLAEKGIVVKSRSINKTSIYKIDMSYYTTRIVHQDFIDTVIQMDGVIEISSS